MGIEHGAWAIGYSSWQPATGSRPQNGMMECWNNGILGTGFGMLELWKNGTMGNGLGKKSIAHFICFYLKFFYQL
jgi:hypothetical protein